MNAIEQLIDSFSRFPGVGRKSAARMVYHLLASPKDFSHKLAERLHNLVDKVQSCKVCGAYSEQEECSICSDSSRDGSVICVIEQPQDILALETSREFNGLYHVLHGVIAPMRGIGPQQLSMDSLLHRVSTTQVKEVILATNPTVEGDITARYIKSILQEYPSIHVSRIALGMPVGGDLEYADSMTIARSIRARTMLT